MNAITPAMVAYHGQVTFLSWKDSSAQGPQLRFSLTDRSELEHFDKVTRRSSKRAGQRYKAAVRTDNMDPHDVELWFCGANWSHQDGARVTFAVTDEELQWWRQLTPRDVNNDFPSRVWLTLVQVDTDEKPIDQVKAEAMAAVELPQAEPVKGGPNSKHVAQLVADLQFQQFLAAYLGSITPFDRESADEWVKDVCGVESKKEFDHRPSAWDTFRERVRRPFLAWLQGAPVKAA